MLQLNVCKIKKSLFVFLFVSVQLAVAHIGEGTGNALQLFSYRITGQTPVIDGSILSRDGNTKTKDAPDEWKEAYTREILLNDGTTVTLFIMNDLDSLYIAALYWHGNNSSGSGIKLYFDQGPTGGAHDGQLTGTSENIRSEAGYQIIKGDALDVSDYSWNGSSWVADADGELDFRADGAIFPSDQKANHREMAIPLQNGKQSASGNSDLNITITDELGLYIEVFKEGSGAGTFYWVATNGDKTNPQSGVGWADLRLNVPRSCFTFYGTLAKDGSPTPSLSLSV
ncbi:MAG: hypothetical protein HQK83_20635 [Fibrobacteria bacterium]|nr:hypothetical protein [Fibrobacteria bacterium]